MTAEKRRYKKKARAKQEENTRRRITESAVALHGTLGPSRTSMSDVARHAGVRRSTLYRHFRDESALFLACSAHWSAANPLPEIESWSIFDDPDQRLAVALDQMYSFYSRGEQMLLNLFRDEQIIPMVTTLFRPFRDYMAAARDALTAARNIKGPARRRQVSAAIGHALAFTTWYSLVREQGLDADEAVELMSRAVTAAER
jgi:AcrR family transcriptional regulator